jgi:thiosulfate/3-mercaptopyruvate sulfurtransferase
MPSRLPYLALLLFASTATAASPAKYPRPDLLIEAADLAKDTEHTRIVDARLRGAYEAGHIPGAVWVSVPEWEKAFAAGPDKKDWAPRIGKLSITLDTPVVVYDGGSVKDAGRIWWTLRYWGVRDVRLLNGGWHAWQEGKYPVSQEEPKPGTESAALAPHTDRLATKEQVLEKVNDKDRPVQLIDARTSEEFCGRAKTAKRNGAIPGAVHLEWSDALDPETQRFKSPEELARMLKDAGIELDRPAVTYCQSGGRASVMAFTLELMGAKDVRNYYRSWAEWGNAEDTPVETQKK